MSGHSTPRHIDTPTIHSISRISLKRRQGMDCYFRPSSLPAGATIAEARDLPFRSTGNERNPCSSSNLDLQDLLTLSGPAAQPGCHVSPVAQDPGYP